VQERNQLRERRSTPTCNASSVSLPASLPSSHPPTSCNPTQAPQCKTPGSLSLSLFLSLTIMWNCPTHENALQNRWMCVCVCVSVSLSLTMMWTSWAHQNSLQEIVCLSMATKKWQEEHPDCLKAVIFQTSSLNSQSPHKF
jgi:hypothetical protein